MVTTRAIGPNWETVLRIVFSTAANPRLPLRPFLASEKVGFSGHGIRPVWAQQFLGRAPAPSSPQQRQHKSVRLIPRNGSFSDAFRNTNELMTQDTEYGPCGYRINPHRCLLGVHAPVVIHPPITPHPGETIEAGTGRPEGDGRGSSFDAWCSIRTALAVGDCSDLV